MKKIEIYKETVEILKDRKDWTAAELENAFDNMDQEPALIGSFETYAEAKAFFDQEKRNCRSYYRQGYVMPLVIFDVLWIEKNEYDDDGDFLRSYEMYDSYVADVEHDYYE